MRWKQWDESNEVIEWAMKGKVWSMKGTPPKNVSEIGGDGYLRPVKELGGY